MMIMMLMTDNDNDSQYSEVDGVDDDDYNVDDDRSIRNLRQHARHMA